MNSRDKMPVARVLLVMILSILCSILPVSAYSFPKPSTLFYVNDAADILSEETEEYIVTGVEDLEKSTGAQVVVVTVPDLDQDAIEPFATEMFRSYGIGDKEKNNGVLILLALEERECRIEVGYGLEGALNDAKVGRIMDDYMIPYFAENQWDEGMRGGFEAIMQEIGKEYGVEVLTKEPEPVIRGTDGGTEKKEGVDLLSPLNAPVTFSVVIGLIIGLISGAALPECARYMDIPWVIIDTIVLCMTTTAGRVILGVFFVFTATVLGWAVTSPPIDGSGSGSYGGYDRSSSYSGSSGSSRSNYGGGGRSGGGGATRKF